MQRASSASPPREIQRRWWSRSKSGSLAPLRWGQAAEAGTTRWRSRGTARVAAADTCAERLAVGGTVEQREVGEGGRQLRVRSRFHMSASKSVIVRRRGHRPRASPQRYARPARPVQAGPFGPAQPVQSVASGGGQHRPASAPSAAPTTAPPTTSVAWWTRTWMRLQPTAAPRPAHTGPYPRCPASGARWRRHCRRVAAREADEVARRCADAWGCSVWCSGRSRRRKTDLTARSRRLLDARNAATHGPAAWTGPPTDGATRRCVPHQGVIGAHARQRVHGPDPHRRDHGALPRQRSTVRSSATTRDGRSRDRVARAPAQAARRQVQAPAGRRGRTDSGTASAGLPPNAGQ